jgi:hypothetical protein
MVQTSTAVARHWIFMAVALIGRSYRGKYRHRFLQSFASDVESVSEGKASRSLRPIQLRAGEG